MHERLKELRKHLGLNQTEFAGRIHVAQTTYSQFENGTRTIKDIHVSQICNAFGVNEEWLRNGTGDMFPGSSEEDRVHRVAKKYSLPEICMKLLYAFDALAPDQQQAVLAYMNNFIASLAQPEPTDEEKNARQQLASRLAAEQAPSSPSPSSTDEIA